MQKGFVIILIVALIIGIFAITNSGVVTGDFIFAEVELSQAIVIFICVLLGAIIASLFGFIRQMSLKKEIKELKTMNNSLQIELNQLIISLKNKEEEFTLLDSENSYGSIDINTEDINKENDSYKD